MGTGPLAAAWATSKFFPQYLGSMAEDNRDPFDFGEDPLADADQLDVPDIGAEYTRSFEPPTAAPGVPPVSPPAAAPPSQFPPPAAAPPAGAAPPPSQFPPPAAAAPPPSQFPPPAANPPYTAAPESPGSFTPDPAAQQFPAVDATPPTAPTGYGDQPHTTPAYLSNQPGQDPGFGTTPPPGAQPPNYGAPGQGIPGQGIPPQQGAPSYAAPAYGAGGPGQPPQKKRRGCLFWGLLLTGLAALLIGGCSALLFFTGRGATDTANDFLTAAEAGDYPAAVALTNPDCGLTEAQIESDLAGASEHFIVGVGPIASGTVRINGIDAAITIEFRDDLVCTYTIESVN